MAEYDTTAVNLFFSLILRLRSILGPAILAHPGISKDRLHVRGSDVHAQTNCRHPWRSSEPSLNRGRASTPRGHFRRKRVLRVRGASGSCPHHPQFRCAAPNARMLQLTVFQAIVLASLRLRYSKHYESSRLIHDIFFRCNLVCLSKYDPEDIPDYGPLMAEHPLGLLVTTCGLCSVTPALTRSHSLAHPQTLSSLWFPPVRSDLECQGDDRSLLSLTVRQSSRCRAAHGHSTIESPSPSRR